MAARPRSYAARTLTRVALYYLLAGALTVVLSRYFPIIQEAFSGGRLEELGAAGSQLFGGDAPPPVGEPAVGSGWPAVILGALSMAGALGIMIPVSSIYMVTRGQRGYDESVVHTLLILPVAVTGIVIIVQHSLALAFSLAGIVAAVRFRTTLEDTKDAVYVFLAIGVGLASGVQALGLALTLSLVFNAVVLVLWRGRVGNVYADVGAGPGGLGLGDALAGPASALTAQHVGDPAVLDALGPAELADVADRAVRMERHISEERGRKKTERANALLIVKVGSAQAGQALVEKVLDTLATRWKLAEMLPGPDGSYVLEYLARLDGPGVEGAVLDRLRGGDAGVVAELRSLKGLKKRA